MAIAQKPIRSLVAAMTPEELISVSELSMTEQSGPAQQGEARL
jgi:hypothetical protein